MTLRYPFADNVDLQRGKIENLEDGTEARDAVNLQQLQASIIAGPEFITSSNVPPLPQMLQASPDGDGNDVRYTMRVTNNTDVDTPAFTQFRFNNTLITVQRADDIVSAFATDYYTFTLTQPQINSLVNNFGDRTANELIIRYGTGANELDVVVLDDVGSEGTPIHYTFDDGTAGRFTVTPSDTGQPQVVLTGSDISIWRPNTPYLEGQLLIRTAESTVDGEVVASAGGLFYSVRAHTSPATFTDNNDIVPIPLTEVEWTAKLFDTRGFYETGDVVTTATTVDTTTTYQLWIHTGVGLDGRINQLTGDELPSSTSTVWMEVMAGGGGETYTISTQASATTGNAILRLDGDESAAQDIEIVGGNNITITQQNNNQLTINATGDLTPNLDVGELQDVTISNPMVGEILGITSVSEGVPAWGNVSDDGGQDISVNGVAQTNPDFLNSTANRGIAWTAIGNNITGVAGADSTKQDNLSSDQLAVVNANAFTDALQTRLGNVQQFALDTTTDIPDGKVSNNIARTTQLINDGDLNNTNIRLFTQGNPSTPIVSIPLGDIGAPVEYVFNTIADRNAGMQASGQAIVNYPNRVIYASVISDTETQTGTTFTSFWTLVDRPASGDDTTSDDWRELGTPGVQISSVIGCVYDPDDADADPVTGLVPVQLGTEDTTEGISRAVADTLYYQQTNNFSEIVVSGDDATTAANREAAQTNLDVAPSEEIVQINARLQDEIENYDAFSNLPHSSNYSYVENGALSDSIDEDANEDFYNSLGLFLVFGSDVSSIVEGDTFYIFDNGDPTSGTPQLVIRRNGIGATTLNTRTQLSFHVVEGFSWLEQFLEQPSFPGSSTRNMNIDTPEGRAAFMHFHTRTSNASLASYVRIPPGGGQATQAHASDSIPSTGSGRGELVSGFAVRQGLDTLQGLINDNWPPVGGFAVENLGEAQVNVGGTSTWPSLSEATVFGIGGITYSRSDGFAATGGPFTFPEASIVDVDVYISSVQAGTNITITASRNSVNEWGGALSDVSVGRHTIRLTKQRTGTYSLPNDEGLNMLLSSNNSGLVYHILAVRWSLTADVYRHIGSVEGGGSTITVDQSYSATSTNAQSGTAVAQAISGLGGGGGYPTISTTELPTTLQQGGNIIYYTGSSEAAEGLYRWSGSAYLPGPRILDIRDTVGTTVDTQAEDVDTITFSNRFTVSTNADIDVANLAIDTAQLAADAVDGTKIEDLAVDTEHLAASAVETAKINDDAVTGPKIANNSVGEGHLLFSNGTTELPGRVITYSTGGFSTIANPVPAIAQNTGSIADNQNRLNALTTRIGDLEDEVHNIEASSTRATTNFYRGLLNETTPDSDSLVTYTTAPTTANPDGVTRPWTLTQDEAGVATFRQGSVALDPEIDAHTTSHISDIYGHELNGGSYTRYESGFSQPQTEQYEGGFITPVAILRLRIGSVTYRVPLRISHDGQGRHYTHLYNPYPVDVDLNYDSYTITYHWIDICLLYTSPSPRDS